MKAQKESPHPDWQKLYESFSAPITSVNCGALCSPKNNGTPHCCSHENQLPVLFTSELAWHTSNTTDMWKAIPLRTKKQKAAVDPIESYIKYSICKGVDHCSRAHRSLTCRFFPFEPYISSKDIFEGITYIYSAKKVCPIVDNPAIPVNPRYVRQAVAVWKKIFAAYPREWELYSDASRKLRRRMARLGCPIKVFA